MILMTLLYVGVCITLSLAFSAAEYIPYPFSKKTIGSYNINKTRLEVISDIVILWPLIIFYCIAWCIIKASDFMMSFDVCKEIKDWLNTCIKD